MTIDIFSSDSARTFLTGLREAEPTAVGDLISGAIRAVAQAEKPLEPAEVQRALVAIALLLAETDESILSGAPDADLVGPWFRDLEIELNPARRQIAGAAISRILLPEDNRSHQEFAGAARALRDLLVDSGADE